MLGTGKVKIAGKDSDPYNIVLNFLKIGNASSNIAENRAGEIFLIKGRNRVSETPATAMMETDRDDILETFDTTATKTMVRQMCGIISKMVNPFTKKSLVAYFISNGTAMRYPEEFKLNINTDDLDSNLVNEEINEKMSKFFDHQMQSWSDAIESFFGYMASNFSDEINREINSKYEGFFENDNTTGNIYKEMRRIFSRHGQEFTAELQEEFSKKLQT